MRSIWSLIYVASLFTFCWGGNILILCPLCTVSHKAPLAAIAEGLVERNHSVTIVSAYKTSIKNIRDIVPYQGINFLENVNVVEARKQGPSTVLRDISLFKKIYEGCHATYQNQEFMALQNETWDLVMMDLFVNHCLEGFIYRLKAPLIISSPVPIPPIFTALLGTPSPSSFVPDPLLPFGEKMNTWERVVNLLVPPLIWIDYFSHYSEYENIYRKYLGEEIPGLKEIQGNVSMVLVNSHFALNSPRPTMPDIVEIGGAHCRPGRPLPSDLGKFIADAKDGVIIFSLGSVVKSGHLPEEARMAFVKAFSRLKQRVIWKWDHDEMNDLPSNVKLSNWLPLQDILAHSNIKLFITHGGLMSTQEAVYHGVPLVGVPLFGDQDANINRYVAAGFAVKLEIIGIRSDEIFDAINMVLNDTKYRVKIQNLSKLFRDQPQSALDRAVFWAEYVMRHKGALHLRSAARNLSAIQYYSLDVIAILSAVLFASIAGVYLTVVKILRKVVKILLFPPRNVSSKKLNDNNLKQIIIVNMLRLLFSIRGDKELICIFCIDLTEQFVF